MKLLKYLFYILLIVIIGAAIYAATKDGKYDIANTKSMNAPASVVFENVNDFKNWEQWGPWNEEDPNLKYTYDGNTVGEGGSYSWESEKMGNGSMKTLHVVENDSIFQDIIFNTPMGDSKSNVYWKFKPTETGTDVTWGMKGEQSFMEKLFMIFMPGDFETDIGEMHDKGLNNLEVKVLESMNKYSINVEGIKEYGGGYYMYTTTACKASEIADKMAPMMGKVAGFMAQNNITHAGMPFTIYNEVDEANGNLIFSAAIPVKERIIVTEGDVLCGYMEPLSAVKAVLSGNYHNLPEAYTKAQEYIGANNLTVDSSKKMFEIYANDPGIETNPSKWLTEVYIPIVKN